MEEKINNSDPFYKSKGKAGEYADDLSLNVFHYCPFACSYCYVPPILKMTKEQYFTEKKIAINILERVRKHAPKYKGRNVFLSFIGDFFNNIIEYDNLKGQILREFINNDISVTILTKGNAFPFMDLLLSINENTYVNFGVTLTTLEIGDIYKDEPNALNPYVRMNQLAEAKKRGFKTWVSIEPILNINQVIPIIEKTRLFTDFYFLGKLNYKSIASYDQSLIDKLPEVISFMDKHKISYKIKFDTLSLIYGFEKFRPKYEPLQEDFFDKLNH